jgi:hypothetical protein
MTGAPLSQKAERCWTPKYHWWSITVRYFDFSQPASQTWLKHVKTCLKHVPRNPLVRPHSNNTSKQYDVLITRGKMKTLAIRSDFDFKFSGFRVSI